MFHDGCTAWIFSDWLNDRIGDCCYAHDYALDSSTDLSTFLTGNGSFFECVSQVSPMLAVITFVAVASPIGWAMYKWGPKRK